MVASRRPRVLVADHDRTFLDQLTERLLRLGFDVDFAETGPTAMRLVTEERYDLMVLELAMPIVNGIDILRKAKQTNPGTPVILFTFANTTDWAEEALAAGAYTYLLRPLNDMNLFDQTVIQCLRRRAAPASRAPQRSPVAPPRAPARPGIRGDQPSHLSARMPDGVMLLDSQARILMVNAGAKRWLMLEKGSSTTPIRDYIRALQKGAAPPKTSGVLGDLQVEILSKAVRTKNGAIQRGMIIRQVGQAPGTSIPQPARNPRPLPASPQSIRRRTASPAFTSSAQPPAPPASMASPRTLKEFESHRWPEILSEALQMGAALGREMTDWVREIAAQWLEQFLESGQELELPDPEAAGAVQNRLATVTGLRKG